MDRSPRLRVRGVRLTRPLEARFRCGSFPNLTSPHAATRWLILQKARRHPARGLRLLAGARFQALFHSPLGVLFTFPSRYLFAIGRGRVFSLGGWSPLLPAGFLVPGGTLGRRRSPRAPSRTGLSPCAAGLPRPFPLRARFLTARGGPGTPARAAQQPPSRQPSWGMRSRGFGPGPVSLAATPGISVDFSSSGVLRCFSSPRLPPAPYVFGRGYESMTSRGFPHSGIRGSNGPFAPPRGLSQLAAPFVDFPRQGIRRAPFLSSIRPARSRGASPCIHTIGPLEDAPSISRDGGPL